MNKKILLPLLALAVIPVLAMGMIPDNADKIGKEFAANNPGVTMGVHTLEEEISEQEEVNRAELIVEGKIIKAKSYWKIIHEDTNPRIFTDYIILVDDTIKGEVKKTIKMTTTGGTLDSVTALTEGQPLEKGDRVIVLLGKDINSVFGDSYVPISVSKSIYVVDDDGKAKNKHDDRSGDKDKTKSRLAQLANS